MFHISGSNSTFKIRFYSKTFPPLFTCWWICLSTDCLILSLITYKLFMWEFAPTLPTCVVCKALSAMKGPKWNTCSPKYILPTHSWWDTGIHSTTSTHPGAGGPSRLYIHWWASGRRGLAVELRKLWETGLRKDTWKVGWKLRGSGSWGHWDLLHVQWYRDQYIGTEVLRFYLKGRPWENVDWPCRWKTHCTRRLAVFKAEGSFTREMKCTPLEEQLTMPTVLLSDAGIHQMVWKTTLEGWSHWSTGDAVDEVECWCRLFLLVLLDHLFIVPPGRTNNAGRWCANGLILWE